MSEWVARRTANRLCRAVWKGAQLERICGQQTEMLFDNLFYDKDDQLSTSPAPGQGGARLELLASYSLKYNRGTCCTTGAFSSFVKTRAHKRKNDRTHACEQPAMQVAKLGKGGPGGS
jgi:hypothetical protein